MKGKFIRMTGESAGIEVNDKLAKTHLYSRREAGQSMAWAAVFLAFILIPLLALVVDGGRLFYVRLRLQTAVDAACEDAAWSAADRRAFRDNGVTTFQNSWYPIALAQNTFNQTLGEQAMIGYTAVVTIRPDTQNARMSCQAYASVPLLTAGGQLYSPVSITASSISKIRFTR